MPRVFDRIYAGVLAKIKEAGGAKALLYGWGYRRKAYFLAQGARHDQARRRPCAARRWPRTLPAAALPGAGPVLAAPRALHGVLGQQPCGCSPNTDMRPGMAHPHAPWWAGAGRRRVHDRPPPDAS